MIPSVENQKTDGNLGVATETERVLAIIGVSSIGSFDTPQAFTGKTDVMTAFGQGPLVECAVYCIQRGIPVVCIRANPNTAAAYGTVTDNTAGTATVTAGAGVPTGDYDIKVEFLTAGALGTAGITYRESYDDGVTWSDTKSLGTALTLVTDVGASFVLGIATNTIVIGDSFSCTTSRAKMNGADLTDSFAALTNYSGEWLRVLVYEECDATMLAACGSFATSFHAQGKNPEVITNTRVRDLVTPETRAAYQTAMAAVVAAASSDEVSPCVDQCEMTSDVSGRRLRMLTALSAAARVTDPTLDDSVDGSQKSLGALPNVFIRSADDSKQYHDEARFPGFDTLGLTTLRTWRGRPLTPGVYLNNVRLISGTGSDYRYFQHTAITNRAIEVAHQLLEQRLSTSVLVETTGTRAGKIREDVAKSLEESITAELRTQFADPGRCSGIEFKLSRNDNILSTDTLTYSVGIVPLGYIKKFKGKTGLVRKLSA